MKCDVEKRQENLFFTRMISLRKMKRAGHAVSKGEKGET
jgi:hypothetical protein